MNKLTHKTFFTGLQRLINKIFTILITFIKANFLGLTQRKNIIHAKRVDFKFCKFNLPSIQRGPWLIHNSTHKTFISSKVWNISSFFLLKRIQF